MDCGFYLNKIEGLFSKKSCEGVWWNMSRWIRSGRPGLDEGRENRRWRAEMATYGWNKQRTAPAFVVFDIPDITDQNESTGR